VTTDLALLANRHWVDAYRRLIDDMGGEWRDFGAVHAFNGGIPLAFANGTLALEPATAAELEAAIDWLSGSGFPYRVRIDSSRNSHLLDVPGRLGLVRDGERMPGMVLRPIPSAPPPAPGISVIRVDADSYDEYIDLIVDGGLTRHGAQISFPPRLVDEPGVALFCARLDGAPAATSLVTRTGDSAGIYAVGTVEHARRRGLGTAVTWAAVEAARAWGCSAVVLQASELGYPVYLQMGFEPVVEYSRFQPPEPAAGSVT